MHNHSNSVVLCSWVVILLVLTGCQWPSLAQFDQKQPVTYQIDLSRYIFPAYGYDAAVVGLLNQHTLVTARYGFNGKSTIDFWNVQTGRLQEQIVPPTPVKSGSVSVSPDGHWLMAAQNVATDLSHPIFAPNTVYLWNLKTHKLLKPVVLKKGRVIGTFFDPNQANQIIITSSFPSRFLRFNILTGQMLKTVPYQYAAYLQQDDVQFSPDKKFFAGLYSPDESQPSGSLDVFDTSTLATVSSVGGTTNHVLAAPLFFLSHTKLVAGSSVYDLKTRQLTSLLAGPPGHFSMANMPAHPDDAIFLAKDGLELWNIPAGKMVQHWVLPRRPRLIPLKKGESGDDTEAVLPVVVFVSRDDKAFGFLGDRGIVHIYDYEFSHH